MRSSTSVHAGDAGPVQLAGSMGRDERLLCPTVTGPDDGLTAEVGRVEWMRLWRPSGVPGVVTAHGRMRSYEVHPQGEYMVTRLTGTSVDITRGAKRFRMEVGQLGLWDPSHSHRGVSSDGAAWEVEILVVEMPTFADAVTDPEGCTPDLEFPTPVLDDPSQVASFLRLHRMLTDPSSALAAQVGVTSWLSELADRTPAGERHSAARRRARLDPALQLACELLQDDYAADVQLADLANAAGVSKFRLLRLFKAGFGVPPHAYQIQVRVQRARALLEAGESPARVAHLVGFYDQSHLTRHFRRMGLTPAEYATAFRASEPVASG